MKTGLLVALALVFSGLRGGAQDATRVYEMNAALSTQPQVVKSVNPDYTSAARAARIQGWVMFSAVVQSDGTVGAVEIVQTQLWQYLGSAARSFGQVGFLPMAEVRRLGLDKQAVNAVKRWLFKPGTKDGEPVAVRVLVELTFALAG
jgi:periplasmic protein TonB